MNYKYILYGISCLFISFVLIVSCNDEDVLSVSTDVQLPSSHYVTYEEALNTAISFLSEDQSITRSERFKVKNHHEFSANKSYSSLTRSNDGLSDSIDVRFHVINFEDNAGFALVSADDRTTPIYAYSTEGNMNLEEGLENTGLQAFMVGAIEHYKNEVETFSLNGPLPFIPDPIDNDSMLLYPIVYYNGQYCYAKGTEHTIQNTPLLYTEWDQCSPYNYYCPAKSNLPSMYEGHAPTGCTTIATAQIMAYHQFPIFLDWDTILSSSYYPMNVHNNITNTVAAYILNVAIALNVDWDNSSQAGMNDIRSAFVNWGYATSSVEDFDTNKVYQSLVLNLPVLCSGSNHAWVIDGYKQTIHTTTYYEIPLPHLVVGQESYGGSMYYHCNWGWGHNYNTYNDGYFLNTFVHPIMGPHNYNNKILYNIFPIIG